MPPAAPDFFADALRREIIRSEQQRMRALAIILAGTLGHAGTSRARGVGLLTHRLGAGRAHDLVERILSRPIEPDDAALHSRCH